MKLHLTTATDQRFFSGHGAGYVAVNNTRYECSVLVTPTSVAVWVVTSFEDLSAQSLEAALEPRPDVLILGTGRSMRFPPREIMKAVSDAGVGLEVMDSAAACRTYNILAAEGRKVTAAVLVE